MHGRTDRGRKRESNEDAFLIADLDAGVRLGAGGSVRPARGGAGLLCAVCDGMGGARAGEVASRLSVTALFDLLNDGKIAARDPEERLRQTIERANQVVYRRSTTDAACQGMGTTLTAFLLLDGFCYLGHVGDSRAYLLHNLILRQLTRDHSLVNFLIDYGVMSAAQAEAMVNRNIILEALGVKQNVTVDTGSLTLQAGDTMLLCSDGLHGTLSDEELRDLLVQPLSLEALSTALIDEANRRGGPDNITVVLCRVGEG